MASKCALWFLAVGSSFACAAAGPHEEPFYTAPPADELARGEMRDIVGRYETDLRALRRFWDVSLSEARRETERDFFEAWAAALDEPDFDRFDVDARIDWLLLKNRVGYELRRLELERARQAETASLLPFASEVAALQETRRALEAIDAADVARRLDAMVQQVEGLEERAEAEPVVANRAAQQARNLRRTLEGWYEYYDGYDPLFSWWCSEPYERLDEALGDYATHLREELAGLGEDDHDTILGDPIGREALLAELRRELISYTPEELIEIAEREFAWCDAEMLRASQELGFGDDWRAAQEHVKTLHVEPGDQPRLIRDLAFEAIDFLEVNELLTIPPFAKAVWRMEMMSPERQQQTPYFTGGEVISVSFPTDDMEHEDKLMSMRGNNVHFSRATVHHELIPGHHLQQFMRARYATHRRPFGTPFWGEGWAVYWEMLLWDRGFPGGPKDRVGLLFWRKHRCARIVFSLRFHLGEMTPEECIDYLVERVGHERRNATAEVRRSVQGGYGPLYQAAYMTGALQFRALHRELVGSGRMSDRELHDAILREGSIPVELVRAKLIGQELRRDFEPSWRFDG
jgi:hypothetical protein